MPTSDISLASSCETPGATTNQWITAPPEIVVEIFKFLDVNSVTTAGLVCKKWFSCSVDNDLWVKPLLMMKTDEDDATIDTVLHSNTSLRDFYLSFRKHKKFSDRVERLKRKHDHHYITAKHLRYYCADGVFLPLVATLVVLALAGAWAGIFFGGLFPQIVVFSRYVQTDCTVVQKIVSNHSSYVGQCAVPSVVFMYRTLDTTPIRVTKNGDCFYDRNDLEHVLNAYQYNTSYTCFYDSRNPTTMALSLNYSTFFVILVAIFSFMLAIGILFCIVACIVSVATCRAELVAIPCLIRDKIQLTLLRCIGLVERNKDIV
jgi:hypothetical protein